MRELRMNPFLGFLIIVAVLAFIALIIVGVPVFIGHVIWFILNALKWTEGTWTPLSKWSVGILLMMLSGGISIKIGN